MLKERINLGTIVWMTTVFLVGSVFMASPGKAADIIIEEDQVLTDPVIAPTRNGFSLTPYFWATFYHGDMTINGQTVDMSGTSVFDLLDAGDLNFPPLVAVMEWDQGEWGAFIDGTLIGLEFDSGDFSLGPGPFTSRVGMDFTYALVNTGLTYQLSEFESYGFRSEVDLMPGLRYTYYDVDLGGNIGPLPLEFNETLHWLDGFVGLRARGQDAEGFTYTLYGDIGGGEGFSAQAFATVGKTWTYDSFDLNLFAGYRYLYQDWSSGDDAVDLSTHGPVLGVKFNF